MARCETCGNEYEPSLQITLNGRAHHFDCFECAAHALAPSCATCHCRILGHGVQWDEMIFCGAHCARQYGARGLTDHVGGHVLVGS